MTVSVNVFYGPARVLLCDAAKKAVIMRFYTPRNQLLLPAAFVPTKYLYEVPEHVMADMKLLREWQ